MNFPADTLESGRCVRTVAWIFNELELGGTTTYFLNYLRWLSGHGITSWIISFRTIPPDIARQFNFRGVTIGTSPKPNQIFEDRVAEVLSQLICASPQVMVVNGGAGASAFELLRYAPHGVKRIGVVLVDQPEGYDFIKNYGDHLDSLVSLSKGLVDRMLSYPSLAKVPQHIWIPGIVEALSIDAREFPLKHDELKVLYLGRLEKEQKRVHLLPEIAHRVRQAGVPVEFSVVGSGGASDYLQHTIERLGITSFFKIYPAEEWERVKKRMLSNDIFLLPSDYEGSPLALLEAMTCGMVPVISDLATGIRDVVDEKSAMLIPPDSVIGYSDAIIRLWKEPVLGASMSAQGRKIVLSGFVGDVLGPKWLDLLNPPPGQRPDWTAKVKLKPVVGLNSLSYHPLLRPLRRLRRIILNHRRS